MFRNEQLQVDWTCGTESVNTLYNSAVLVIQFVWGVSTIKLGRLYSLSGAQAQSNWGGYTVCL